MYDKKAKERMIKNINNYKKLTNYTPPVATQKEEQQKMYKSPIPAKRD